MLAITVSARCRRSSSSLVVHSCCLWRYRAQTLTRTHASVFAGTMAIRMASAMRALFCAILLSLPGDWLGALLTSVSDRSPLMFFSPIFLVQVSNFYLYVGRCFLLKPSSVVAHTIRCVDHRVLHLLIRSVVFTWLSWTRKLCIILVQRRFTVLINFACTSLVVHTL